MARARATSNAVGARAKNLAVTESTIGRAATCMVKQWREESRRLDGLIKTAQKQSSLDRDTAREARSLVRERQRQFLALFRNYRTALERADERMATEVAEELQRTLDALPKAAQ